MRAHGLRRGALAGPPEEERDPGRTRLPIGRRAPGESGCGLRGRQPPSHDRHRSGAGGARRRRRDLLCHRLHRGGGGGRRASRDELREGVRRDAARRPELLRPAELRRRRHAVARPAGWSASRRGRRHHHHVLQRRLQPDHAAPRAADRLRRVARQQAEVRPPRRDPYLRRQETGHGHRALRRGDLRPAGRSRRAVAVAAKAGQADRRAQVGPFGGGAADRALPHRLPGRLRRVDGRSLRRVRRRPGGLAGGADGGAQGASSSWGPLPGWQDRRHEHLGGRPLAARRRDGRHRPDHARALGAGTERVRATVHERIVVANPLDYQMFDWNDEERLADTFSAFLAEGFDVSLCLLDSSTGGQAAMPRPGAEPSRASCEPPGGPEPRPRSLDLHRHDPRGVGPAASSRRASPRWPGSRPGLAGLRAAVDVGDRLEPRSPPAASRADAFRRDSG